MSRVPHWLLELDGRRIRVEVPATSANLGAGYDCLALALELVNQVEMEVRCWSRGEVALTITGEGEGAWRTIVTTSLSGCCIPAISWSTDCQFIVWSLTNV